MKIIQTHIGIIYTFLFLVVSHAGFASEIKVGTIEEFNSAIAAVQPGDRIILKNGEWKNVKLIIKGKGTRELPIIVEAEESGKVFITGDSHVRLGGDYLIVKGLWFKDGFTSSKSVLSFRINSKEFATNSRITDCAITYYNPATKAQKYKWVDIWGKNNRVDHNYFVGKSNEGATLVVWLKGDEHILNNHRIDHNHFDKRPTLGYNGAETIRIGTSKTSMSSSRTIVEDNIFEKCNGEVEIISNKSCDNIYRNNLFLESEGVLTLRHGNTCLVEGNIFVGNQKPHTGGIRIINAGHVVRNNLMMNLTGDGFRGPIVVMNGVPNSPINRYHQVKNVSIQNNTIINCSPIQFCAGSDDERSLAPENTTFANNLIYTQQKNQIIAETFDTLDGFQFYGNVIDGDKGFDKQGFSKLKVNWDILENILFVPRQTNPELLKKSKADSKSPKIDITGAARTSYTAGAFNLGNKKIPKALILKSGTSWNSKIEAPIVKANTTVTEVEPGVGTLRNAIKKASTGSTLKLKPGEYIIEKSIKVTTSVTITADENKEKPVIKIKEGLEKIPNYIFRVSGGNTLRLKNLELTGKNSIPIKYAVVSPDKDSPAPYSLFIVNCYLHDFKNKKGGSVYKAYKGTFADSLSITNSRIENSYRGLNLSYEKDDKGKYNAQVILLKNTVFNNIEEWALNYYRGGSDESTVGGQLFVDHCIFSNVGNKEKGTVLKTKGIVWVTIKNSVFEKSYKVVNPVNLQGSKNTITNCLISDCGTIKVSKNAKGTAIIYKKPKWEDAINFIPSVKSPLIKATNETMHIGLISSVKQKN